jgi:hypothetical protein
LFFFCGEKEETRKNTRKARFKKRAHTTTEEYDASSGENFSLLFLFLLARTRRRKSFGG